VKVVSGHDFDSFFEVRAEEAFMRSGNIPVLSVHEDTIPRAYEKAIKAVWEKGVSIRTEYDRPGDPPSRDATVVITINQPFGQPRFHRSFADGLGGLAEYVLRKEPGIRILLSPTL
jgi:thymidylate synthase